MRIATDSMSLEEQSKPLLPAHNSHGALGWRCGAAVVEKCQRKAETAVTGEQQGMSGCGGTSRRIHQG